MPSPTRRRGDSGEDIAANHLKSLRWRIIARNLDFRVGELDLVAEDGDDLVFVEVRSTTGLTCAPAAHTVTLPKQRRLTRAAHLFLARYTGACPYARFDVIGVDLARAKVIEHIRGAFDAAEF